MSLNKSEYAALLLYDYFIRDLTDEELVLLNSALETDAELRQKYAQMTRDEVLLHKVHEAQPEAVKMGSFKKKKSSRRSVLELAASLAVLLTVGGFVIFFTPATLPTVPVAVVSDPVAIVSDYYVIHGDTISAQRGSKVRSLRLGASLYMGDTVDLPKGSRLSFQYLADDTALEIQSDSRFKLLETAGAKHIQLVHGTLRADVDQQDPEHPMRVLTDESEMVVLGTEFVFMNDSIERLSVRSGCVQMNERKGKAEQKVYGGYYVERLNRKTQAPRPFEERMLHAEASRTLNARELKNPATEKYIVIDPERNLRGLVSFDLGDFSDEIVEATLRVRVVKFYDDIWGEGTLRVFQVGDASAQTIMNPSAEMATYTGKVGAGMNLEFKLDPKKITPNMNDFIIQLDEGGNDFWFSSNKGSYPPELELKFVRETPRDASDL